MAVWMVALTLPWVALILVSPFGADGVISVGVACVLASGFIAVLVATRTHTALVVVLLPFVLMVSLYLGWETSASLGFLAEDPALLNGWTVLYGGYWAIATVVLALIGALTRKVIIGVRGATGR